MVTHGPGAAKILKSMKLGKSWETASRQVFPDGSFGNGAAMRSAVVGNYFSNDSDDEIVKAAEAVAVITHPHPLGVEGAKVITLSSAWLLKDRESLVIFRKAKYIY